jgi:hypothetical protein
MHFTQHSKANAFNIGTFIRFYMQMQVEKNNLLSIEFINTSHNSVLSIKKFKKYCEKKDTFTKLKLSLTAFTAQVAQAAQAI